MSGLAPLAGMDYLQGQGWTPAQSAGILGNIYGESGFNHNAVGDGGSAFGLAQWHPDRQATFARVMGTDIRQSTPMQQLQFVNWELNNTESKAGQALRTATNPAQAAQIFMQKYERPANLSSLGTRIASAKSLLEKGNGLVKSGAKLLGIDLGDAAVMAANAFLPGSGAVLSAFGVGGDDCNWICQIKNWIADSGFFQRIALAILGFLILASAFYLIKPSVLNVGKG